MISHNRAFHNASNALIELNSLYCCEKKYVRIKREQEADSDSDESLIYSML